jgi:hypothetical protein
MNTMNETSKPKAADPVCVFIGSTLDTSAGSVAFSELEKGHAGMAPSPELGVVLGGPQNDTLNHDHVTRIQAAAEAQDGHPVASGTDPHIICRWCHFQVRFGRDPLSFVGRCNLCLMEEAQNA